MASRLSFTMAGVVVAVTLLLWPAFYNHQPFFFPDTTAYVRGADAAVAKLTGVLAILMFAAGLGAYLWRRPLVMPGGLVAIGAALIVAALCGTAFTKAVTSFVGEPPLTPPFLMQTAVSLRNAAEQAFLLKATEFGYTPEEKLTFARKLPASYLAAMRTTPAYSAHLSILFLDLASYVSTAIGSGTLAIFWIKGRFRQVRHPLRLVSWVVSGVIANAVVCGVMSGPHDRYQARVAWLLPALALIAHFQIYQAWWERKLRCPAT